MSFKKLALVTAMFAATSGAFAMEAMDEEALAATTGQDGITIGINTSATLDVIIHDKNGFTGAASAGAIYLSGVGLGAQGGGDAQLAINIDAGHDGTNDAALNINIASANAITVDLGELSVSESTGYAAGTTVAGATILDMGSVNIGAGTLMNIQLGHEYQGHLIVIDTELSGGISLTNFALNDLNGGAGSAAGSISVGTVAINDAGAGGNLNALLGIDATVDGLKVTVSELGVAGTGVGTGLDVSLANVNVGGAGSIGDIEIRGLNLNGDVITISGH